MAVLPDYIEQRLRVLDATSVTDTGVTTSLVECRGAKQVVFVVRCDPAEDSDTFVVPTLVGKVASDSDTITAVALSPTATNKLGLLAGTIPAATAIGSQGSIVSLFPEGIGTEAGTAVGARAGCHSVGLTVTASAGLTLSNTIVDAYVYYA